MSSRSQIRQNIRQQRRALDNKQRQHAASGVFRQLVSNHKFFNSQRIACYLACDGELDLERVIFRAWQMKKTIYLPVLDGMNRSRLWFAPFRKASRMIVNNYGVLEPSVSSSQLIKASELDLILLPLVAFDGGGNRLGMGGGYYDHTLAYMRQRSFWKKPHLYGVAYDFQRVEEIESESWDVPLQCIVTETGIIKTRQLSAVEKGKKI